jgi:hypothetical protein
MVVLKTAQVLDHDNLGEKLFRLLRFGRISGVGRCVYPAFRPGDNRSVFTRRRLAGPNAHVFVE